jgi:hypothetical protein
VVEPKDGQVYVRCACCSSGPISRWWQGKDGVFYYIAQHLSGQRHKRKVNARAQAQTTHAVRRASCCVRVSVSYPVVSNDCVQSIATIARDMMVNKDSKGQTLQDATVQRRIEVCSALLRCFVPFNVLEVS